MASPRSRFIAEQIARTDPAAAEAYLDAAARRERIEREARRAAREAERAPR